tara:strand:- start:58 stop:432 length:375 start_codon:yes stop_codon:yes gene_type:complete
MNTEEANKFIKENKIFCFKSMFAGKESNRAVTVVSETKFSNWYHAIDLQFNPHDYLNLSGDDFIKAIKGKHLLIISDKEPKISNISDCLNEENYKNFSEEELNTRADLVIGNQALIDNLKLINL